MAKMCVRSRSRRICWSASELVSGSPAAFWKNQAGVWLCQTSTWPYTRRSFSWAKSMMAVAWACRTKLRSASYHASGFMWFSGVTWLKWRRSSCDGEPAVSRLSMATPSGKSTVVWMPGMSSMTAGSGTRSTMSSTRNGLVLPVSPPTYCVSK